MIKRFALRAVAGLLVGCAAPGFAAGVTQYHGGLVFDGRSFSTGSICVSGRMILRCEVPFTQRVDLEGGFVIPPFGDAHTHHFDSSTMLPAQREMYLGDGVFYAMTMTAPSKNAKSIRNSLSGPDNVDVLTALGGITGPRSHPAEIYEALALRIYDYREQVARAEEIRASEKAADNAYFVVENRQDVIEKWPLIAGYGPDLLKVYLRLSNRYEEGFGKWGPGGGIDPQLLPLLRQLSEQRGLRLAVSASNVADFRAALDARADIVTHLPCYQDSGADPTSPYYHVDTPEQCRLSAKDTERASASGLVTVLIASEWENERPEQYVEWEKHNIALLEGAGAPLAIGSNAYGRTITDGLIAGVRKGFFEPARALRLATTQTARAIFPHRPVGCLEPGCEASFIVLAGNPLHDIGQLRNIRLRVKDGRPLE